MPEQPEYLLSEAPAIATLQTMGYDFVEGSELVGRNHKREVILRARLEAALQRINPWMEAGHAATAANHLLQVQGTSLMDINQNVWKYLRTSDLTLKLLRDNREEFHPVWFIDFRNPANNDFLVLRQQRYSSTARDAKPDLVIFLNGIPVAVIECKSPSASRPRESAIDDLRYYQKHSERLFHFNVLCVGLWRDGGSYGAIGAPAKFYSSFSDVPEDLESRLGHLPTAQDVLLCRLFDPQVLPDFIRNYVIFEYEEGRLIKKLPRHQQIRATEKAILKLQQENEGGVIWHTQGSGKSLTMAYIARKLQADEYGFQNPTILILTDRIDLDEQISGTFVRVGFPNVQRANSVKGLQILLRNDYGGIVTSTLQKFMEPDGTEDDSPEIDQDTEVDQKARRIHKSIKGNILTRVEEVFVEGEWEVLTEDKIELQELTGKENVFVFVDEAHRSQYGFLAAFMRNMLPHAKFLAFTGTPLSKLEKSTLGEFYGGDYIDVYTYKEAVRDGATVELYYQAGTALMSVRRKELDAEFETHFASASAEKRDQLKKQALREYYLSSGRIEAITRHLLNHYQEKIFPAGHKAMLVTTGRHAAIAYKKMLGKLRSEGVHDFQSRVVVSLGSVKNDRIAEELYSTLTHNKEHPEHTLPVYVTLPEEVQTVSKDFTLPFGNEAEQEKSGKKKYDNTAILIVSDMLLTGYDVPIASCMYLDKSLNEHNLLQAIARVNRSREKKKAGFVVDYYGVWENLQEALTMYGGELELRDVMKDMGEELPRLELRHTQLVDHFRSLDFDRKANEAGFADAALRFLAPQDLRDTFRDLFKKFSDALAIVLPSPEALPFQPD